MAQGLRTTAALFAIAQQTTVGEAKDPTLPGDAVKGEFALPQPSPETEQTNEVLGTLSRSVSIVGGIQMQVSPSVLLRGAAAPGAAPNWDKLALMSGLARDDVRQDIAVTADFAGSGMAAATGDVSALTQGTVVYIAGETANGGEYIATDDSTAGERSFARLDGTAANFASETDVSVTLRFGVAGVATVTDAPAGAMPRLEMDSAWTDSVSLRDGLPIVVSGGGLAKPWQTVISAHEGSRVIEVGGTLSTPLATGARVSVRPCVRYRPREITDDFPYFTFDGYYDGVLLRLKDCQATLEVTAEAKKVPRASITISGRFVDEAAAAVPAVAFDSTDPGTFRDSAMEVDGAKVALNQMTLSLGNQVSFDDDPNDVEGFEAPCITQRTVAGSLNPKKGKTVTESRLRQLRQGGRHLISARVEGGQGRLPGGRVAITVPRAQYSDLSLSTRNSAITEDVTYEADGLGADRDAYIAVY